MITKPPESRPFPLAERARAFIRALPDLEPMVGLAREGFRSEGIPLTQKIDYAMKILESESCGPGEIAFMLRELASPATGASGPESGPYRGGAPRAFIPPSVQDRLCMSFLEKSFAASGYIDMLQKEASPENAPAFAAALYNSRMEKGALAYGLLSSGLIDSPAARRSLTRVFCLAGKEMMRGGIAQTREAADVLEGLKNQYGSGRSAELIPNRLSPRQAGFVLSEVSMALCGADVSVP